jgi:hypothetical protein
VIAAASVYFGVTTSAKSDPMTDLLMANVEALAQYEGNGGAGTQHTYYCPNGPQKCVIVSTGTGAPYTYWKE